MILFILPSFRMVSKLSKKIRTATIGSTSSFFTHTCIPLFDLDFSDLNSSSEVVRSRCTSRFLCTHCSELFWNIQELFEMYLLHFRIYFTT